MHKVNDTSRIVTVIGLIVEGLAVATFALLSILFNRLVNGPIDGLIESELEPGLADFIIGVVQVFSVSFIVIGILIFTVFIVNIVLFVRLLKGCFKEEQARHVYLYQAIWGGVSLLFNTITGVLYIISAVKGLAKPHEDIPREGI